MNKDKRNNIQLLGTLNNADESGIIANANQVYDANEDKSTQDVSKEHKERIETLETKESSMQTTLENITKTGEASAASNVTYNHNDSKLDATNMQQAIDEVRKRSNYNDGDDIIDFNSINLITNSSRYIYALVDGNENLILGILRSNCHIVYGSGIPDEVKEYIDNQINKILGTNDISSTIDSLKEIENFLKDFSNSDTLKQILEEKADISKVNSNYKLSNVNDSEGNTIPTGEVLAYEKSDEYIKVEVDGNGNVVKALRSDGTEEHIFPIMVQENIIQSISNEEYIVAIVDNNKNLIIGIKRNNLDIEIGNGKISSNIENDFNDIKESFSKLSAELTLIKDGNENIPSYYSDYLKNKIEYINKNIQNSIGECDSFVFITDVHIPSNNMQSPKLIKYILQRTPIKKLFYGGDTPEVYIKTSDVEQTVRDIAVQFVNWLIKPLLPYCDIYCANGNHDFAIESTILTEDKIRLLPMTFSKSIYMNYGNRGTFSMNTEDSDCCYFYVDNNAARIRYIVLNTTDSWRGKNTYAENYSHFGEVQSNWIYKTIKNTPKGYDLVFIGHEASVQPQNVYNKSLHNYISAIANKDAVNINNTDYDFTDAPNIIAGFWGHTHVDEISYEEGFPNIVVACDAAYNDYQHIMFGSIDVFPKKYSGNTNEQTFDIVSIDKENKVILLTRIGGGYDRICHYEVIDIKLGETKSFTSEIENPQWDIADAIDNPKDNLGYLTSLNKTVATITNGLVTPVKVGKATVCSYNNDTLQMEWWGINVINQ